MWSECLNLEETEGRWIHRLLSCTWVIAWEKVRVKGSGEEGWISARIAVPYCGNTGHWPFCSCPCALNLKRYLESEQHFRPRHPSRKKYMEKGNNLVFLTWCHLGVRINTWSRTGRLSPCNVSLFLSGKCLCLDEGYVPFICLHCKDPNLTEI